MRAPVDGRAGKGSHWDMESLSATLEKDILSQFPIAKFLEVRVGNASATHVTLTAPLAANTNHENTAFGGSVYSVAVLSCWALVSIALEEWGLDTDYAVVQDGHMDYTIPIGADFEAQSSWSSEREAEKFRSMLKRKGVARAHLCSIVRSQGRDCATMEARFAARIELKTKVRNEPVAAL